MGVYNIIIGLCPDNDAYPHDGRADKRRYWHDRRADSQCLENDS